MKFYGEIMVGLKNADIHLHYANNRGVVIPMSPSL
jgi:hypothetical protein